MIAASTSSQMRHEIGAHRKRVEDPRLLRGEGQYVEDLPLHNVVEVAFLRSAHAHARLTHLDVGAARHAPGVLEVWTGEQVRNVTDYATGAYHIDAYRGEGFGVYTTTSPTGPYRGAGRPEAAFVAERTVEEVGRALGLDPVEVRRRNFIRPDQFPYTNGAGTVYDSGDYERVLNRALKLVDYAGLREKQRHMRADAHGEGRPLPLFGIGVATTVEVSGQGQEFGSIEVEPGGGIAARTGSSSHGQGHETTFAQVIADTLGVPFDSVRILHGDTQETPTGGGTGGSRSLVVGGSALAASAEEIKKQAIQIASGLFEVSPDDLAFGNGGVHVAGVPDRRLSLGEIAAANTGGLRHADSFVSPGDAVPFGATVAVVNIDRGTGRVRLERLVSVDDCGTVVNPLIVDGQVLRSTVLERQDVGEVVLDRLFELFIRTRPRLAVGSPADELGGMSEADAFHVFVANLHHALRPKRRERQVLANCPSAAFGGAWGTRTFFLPGPRPRVVVEGGDQRLQLDEQFSAAGGRERPDHAD